MAESTAPGTIDRKSTRLNSSHLGISYAVFCLKKKNLLWSLHPVRRAAPALPLAARTAHERLHGRAASLLSPASRPATATACPLIFFFNDTATTEIYPLSLHDALPISIVWESRGARHLFGRNGISGLAN